jgi:hypothetical protein
VQGGIIRSLQSTTLAELVQFSGSPVTPAPITAPIASTQPLTAAPAEPLTVAAPATN